MTYLLDANVWIDALRSSDPNVIRRMNNVIADDVRLSSIVLGKLRFELESIGQPIGSNDLWIAAQAVANDLVLVTANDGEFSRVPSLKLENWRL